MKVAGKGPMGKRLTSRFANGVVAALITAGFLVHGTLGALMAVAGLSSSLSWLVWGAVGLAGVHVVASVVTSVQQLTDAERPPSARKKRHLALKWATGALLGVVAAVHIALPASAAASAGAIVALSVVLAVHLCVCSRSLLKDLGIDRRYKTAFRVAVCAFAALFVVAIAVGAIGGLHA